VIGTPAGHYLFMRGDMYALVGHFSHPPSQLRVQDGEAGRFASQQSAQDVVPHVLHTQLDLEVRAHMLALVEAQADITIAELRDKIYAEKGVAISWTLTQNWVKRLGLRLKKSRSTPSSETLKPTAENVPSFISAS